MVQFVFNDNHISLENLKKHKTRLTHYGSTTLDISRHKWFSDYLQFSVTGRVEMVLDYFIQWRSTKQDLHFLVHLDQNWLCLAFMVSYADQKFRQTKNNFFKSTDSPVNSIIQLYCHTQELNICICYIFCNCGMLCWCEPGTLLSVSCELMLNLALAPSWV